MRQSVVGRLTLAVALLMIATVATAQSTPPRLLVMDLSYERVWEGAVRAFGEQTLARAAHGVIETTRAERAPLPDETGVERVAERVTVRVEAMAVRVTRITVTVETEGLQQGSWRSMDASPATVRAVLDRIRASIG